MFYSNQLVNDRESIVRDHFLSSKLIQTIFVKLKQLFVSFSWGSSELNLDQTINQFKELEQLEFNVVYYKEYSTLNLPNLKILNLYDFTRKYRRGSEILIVDTPKLIILKLNTANFKFIHAKSVAYLDNNSVFDEKDFINLEYLFYCNSEHVDRTLLTSQTKLKELHFYIDDEFRYEESNENYKVYLHFKRLYECAIEMYEEKQKLARDDLIIYFYGLNIQKLAEYYPNLDQEENMKQLDKDVTIDFNFYAKCYLDLNNALQWVKTIYFNGISSIL